MSNFPLVTIIIPIHNELTTIDRCLQAIFAQDYRGNIEILVADGMSTDGSREIVQKLAARHPEANIRLLDNPGKIVPIGLNIALRQARGEIIIRVDGHCVIAPDYVRRCVEHLLADGVEGVGGAIETVGQTPIAKAIALGMSSPFGVGNSAFRTKRGKDMLVDTVPFPAYPRAVIERVGLYDEELVRNQDDEYNYRIRALGGKILLGGDVRSIYFSRASLKGLWRQFFQYGFYKVRVLQKHPRQMSLRQFVPPVFVLSLFASVLLTVSPALRPLSLVLPVTYLLTNLTATISTWRKSRYIQTSAPSTAYSQAPDPYSLPLNPYSLSPNLYSLIPNSYLLLLPLVFAVLHISYGLGFLLGLIKFWNRWGDRTGKVPAWIDEPA